MHSDIIVLLLPGFGQIFLSIEKNIQKYKESVIT